ELVRLVACRSVANPAIEPVSECRAAASMVADLFADAGIAGVAQLETSDGSVAVAGRTAGPPGAPSVVLYSHYDVVPAGDTEAWGTPPWQLAERGGRWYGRGAADGKG